MALTLLMLGLGAGRAMAELAVPDLRARVTDQTATLDDAQRAALEARLQAFEAEKGSQIAILLVDSTQPETIEQYAMRVAEAWKLGRKGVDDGILLLVAKTDRSVRIEVGYGLEGAVNDALAKRIIEETIVPRFREGDFAGGIDLAVTRLIGLVHGEPLPEPSGTGSGSRGSLVNDFAPLVLIFSFVIGGLFRALFGRFLGASITGGLGFLGAWWLLGTFGIALAFGAFVFFVALTTGSGGGISSGGGGGWSSGGGGGGFGGGGGGFGGGGASGRW
jgi:uncharacterized protein